jgi:hypothetical protein
MEKAWAFDIKKNKRMHTDLYLNPKRRILFTYSREGQDSPGEAHSIFVVTLPQDFCPDSLETFFSLDKSQIPLDVIAEEYGLWGRTPDLSELVEGLAATISGAFHDQRIMGVCSPEFHFSEISDSHLYRLVSKPNRREAIKDEMAEANRCGYSLEEEELSEYLELIKHRCDYLMSKYGPAGGGE